MRRPDENPNEQGRTRNNPSSRNKQGRNPDDRAIPARRTSEYERLRSRGLNEDEQRKSVNTREDNAQSHGNTTPEQTSDDSQDSFSRQRDADERLEAGDDENEIDPRPPKVN